MKKIDTLLVIATIAIIASIGLVAMLFGITGHTFADMEGVAVAGMITGLSGIIFGIMSFRYYVK